MTESGPPTYYLAHLEQILSLSDNQVRFELFGMQMWQRLFKAFPPPPCLIILHPVTVIPHPASGRSGLGRGSNWLGV